MSAGGLIAVLAGVAGGAGIAWWVHKKAAAAQDTSACEKACTSAAAVGGVTGNLSGLCKGACAALGGAGPTVLKGVDYVTSNVTGLLLGAGWDDRPHIDLSKCPAGSHGEFGLRGIIDHRGFDNSKTAYGGTLGSTAGCVDDKGTIIGTLTPDGFQPIAPLVTSSVPVSPTRPGTTTDTSRAHGGVTVSSSNTRGS